MNIAEIMADILWEDPFTQKMAAIMDMVYKDAQKNLAEGENMRVPIFGNNNQVTYTKINGEIKCVIDKPDEPFIEVSL